MIAYRMRSPDWRTVRVGMANRTGTTGVYGASLRQSGKLDRLSQTSSAGRITGGFEYVGPALDRTEAKRFAESRSVPFGSQRSFLAVETIVLRWPGATTQLVARLGGITIGMARTQLAELVAAGRITRAGAGGSGARRYAYYAVPTEALAEQ